MKLPLLLGARPKFVKEGPWVPLSEGEWRVTASHVDSLLSIESALGSVIPFLDKEIMIRGKNTVRILVNKPGNEPSIEAYAELL